jgi:putative membrane protein
MKILTVLAFVAGALAATLIVAHFGFASVFHVLPKLGWAGFAAVLGFHLLLVLLMGTAWWLLGSDRADGRWRRYIWGRMIRDGASEVLPFSQIGGFVIGARATAVAGVKGSFAAASTVVDLTMELIAQLAYTALGLGLLAAARPDISVVGPLALGLAGMTVAAIIFLFVQARGAGLVERIGMKLAAQWLGATLSGSSMVQVDIHEMHQHRRRLLISASVHFLSWVLSGVEAWITLHLMGVSVSLTAALVIDSLIYGIRSFAFMIPNALGVQEAAYVMLGSLFGVTPDVALALSLIRRGRDIVLGTPVLIVWQLIEGKRAFNPVDLSSTA